MKKKMLSLLLVMAMLLSIVPMAGATGEAAEQKFTGYNLFLQNSIAIEFEANRAAIEEGFEKVEFYIGEELVQTRTTLPEADENGNVSFRCTKLTPAQLGENVTAKLYIDGAEKHSVSTSVKAYCMYILNDAETYSDPELRTMLVDLLNYGAATQTFANAGTTLVNADLSEEFKALATAGDLALNNACKISEYSNVTAPTVSWYGVGLNLKDSITLCYEFVADSIENLAIHFFNNDNSLDAWVTNFEQVEGTENHYYAYFGMLNPTQLSETISAVAYTDHNSSNRQMESHKLLYSAESYAYAVANGTYSAELKALTDAMMRYGDAVRRWNCDHGEYENGRCAVCEMEKVFEMTTDTITIQAEDAILNMTGTKDSVDRIMENPNAAGGKIVKLQATHSSSYADKTATVVDGINYEGSIIVKFIPKLSGTYTVSARAIDNAGAVGGMVAAEDDTETKYTRQGISETSNPGLSYDDFMTTDQFVSGLIGSSYEFVAGKTYAIRILSTTSNLAFDEFVITHVHTYIGGVCACGEKKVATTTDGFAVIEAEDWQASTTYATKTANNAASGGYVVKLSTKNNAAGDLDGTDAVEASIDVTVKPDVTGTYYIWVRKGYYSKGGCNTWVSSDTWEDSDGHGDDDGAGEGGYQYLNHSTVTKDTDSDLGWVKLNATPTWTADGEYHIKIATTSTYVGIDQFVITTNAKYTPSGIVTAE